MKNINKMALATAIAAAPFSVTALEALDDEFLGEVTGQEGITIEQDSFTTIEEFQYVDGDGDGSNGPGKVILSNIRKGDFSNDIPVQMAMTGTPYATDPANAPLGTMRQLTEIDATANGVLITTKEIGYESNIVVTNDLTSPTSPEMGLTDASGNLQWNATTNKIAKLSDSATNAAVPGTYTITDIVDASGNTVKNLTKGNGLDIHVGGILLGNANGAMNSIGSLTVLNMGNFIPAQAIVDMERFGVGDGRIDDIMFNNANKFLEVQTLVSSKTSGTGVHIVTESANAGAHAVYYEDTDGGVGGNQIGVLQLANFRLADTDDINSVDRELDSGTYLRGARSEFDIDVEGGKLVLSNQIQDSSTILNKIFIGNVNTATLTGAGVIGGVAILGNHTEGTTSIYAH